MGSQKKESKKEKWQRIAKKQKVKFQKNDTIAMLVSASAPSLGVDPTKGNAKQLEEKVEKAFNDANAPKKPATKPDAK